MKLPKKITIEVLTRDNKRVLKRLNIRAPQGQRLTEQGCDNALEKFVTWFDQNNPGHRYRLVECAGRVFRMVWEAETAIEMVAAGAMANSPCEFTMPIGEANDAIPA
jgi:hypothetical protein